ncbi:unnamed protein product [Prunus brigantina]
MRYGCAWACQHGGAPARCSESDGRLIYGVNEMTTGMVFRRLEKIKGRMIY